MGRAIIEVNGLEITVKVENWEGVGAAVLERIQTLLWKETQSYRAHVLANARVKEEEGKTSPLGFIKKYVKG